MPNPLNSRRWEQWRDCDRCGSKYPFSALVREKGLVICRNCTDDLTIERRELTIAQILGQGEQREGSDRIDQLYIMPDRAETEYL